MRDLRMRVAAGLLTAVLSLLGVANVAAAAPTVRTEVHYVCSPAQRLVITRSATSAAVDFIDRRYELKRKPSSVGNKYLSDAAALIIDGPSAVFVAEDRFQIARCIEAASVAFDNESGK